MNKIQKIIIFLILLLLLTITIYTYYLNTEKIYNQEQLAIVTFNPENQKSISIICEVASTPKIRSKGLMNRDNLPNDTGMLFIYDMPKNISFWMKDVLIPLDIIFIDKEGFVINIESADIQPNNYDSELIIYKSLNPAKYVIEINQGLSNTYDIKKGTQINIKYI